MSFSFADGDWKVTVATGDLENAGTTATVFLYVYGEVQYSGPIILGSGKHQLFSPNSADIFKVKLVAMVYHSMHSPRYTQDDFCLNIAFALNFLDIYEIFYPKGNRKEW